MKRVDIVAAARELIGTRYAHQGRVAGLAADCAFVPIHAAHSIGMDVQHLFIARYGRHPVPAEMRAALDDHLDRIPVAQMQPGDVVWMRFDGEPQHLGVVGDYVHGGLSLIHAYNGAGVNKVVEHRLDENWRRRIVAAWQFRGVEA
jgi:hypothetical protein